MSHADQSKVPPGTRMIRTGRTMQEINEAISEGYRALVLPVVPSDKIRNKRAVFRHVDSGALLFSGDYRDEYDKTLEKISDWRYFYPYSWPEPFAAYLLPPDLEEGDTVWLEDLIEDEVASSWNQGDACRLDSCLAVWTGEQFDLLFDRDRDRRVVMG